MLTELPICGPNLAQCEEEALQYQGKFVENNFYHYEFLNDHFIWLRVTTPINRKLKSRVQRGSKGRSEVL